MGVGRFRHVRGGRVHTRSGADERASVDAADWLSYITIAVERQAAFHAS
jgi:hypothetical protein